MQEAKEGQMCTHHPALQPYNLHSVIICMNDKNTFFFSLVDETVVPLVLTKY